MSVSTRLSPKLKRSNYLRNSIVSNAKKECGQRNVSSDDDFMFTHILDCIGALSCIRKDQLQKKNADRTEDAVVSSKFRIFWQAVREIADQELKSGVSSGQEKDNASPAADRNKALEIIMENFPDRSKLKDFRMWLPLHFAVLLPSTDLMDIHNIFVAQPQAIKVHTGKGYQFNPCHLAVTTQNPRLEVLRQLKVYYPRFGSSVDYNQSTPLHLVAMFTENMSIIREIVQLYPSALEMRNKQGGTPLHVAINNSVWTASMVQQMAQLHPPALEVKNKYGHTPLHLAAMHSRSAAMVRELVRLCPAALEVKDSNMRTPLCLIGRASTPEALKTLQVLLDAAPQAASIPDSVNGRLPLHALLANHPNVELVGALLAAYKDAVNIADNDGMLPVHHAARNGSVEVLKMIAEENISNLSVVSPDGSGSVAHCAVENAKLDNLRYIHSIVPDILSSVDVNFDSVLFHFLSTCWYPFPVHTLSGGADILQFLLRHCPSLSTTTIINSGKKIYDYVSDQEDPRRVYVCRLLLRAGASLLHPGDLEELNYGERKSALLCFFGAATKVTIFSRISMSAAGPELMRTIVSFL